VCRLLQCAPATRVAIAYALISNQHRLFPFFTQAWNGSASNGQYDSLLTCMEAARARELPLSFERNLVMLHSMKPHYDPVKDGEGLDGLLVSFGGYAMPCHTVAAL
jgi:membrane protein required for beta-lactamase induction